MTTDRASTGISGLDEVLCGGLVRNQTYLLTGPAGTGKTTFGWHYLTAGVAQAMLYNANPQDPGRVPPAPLQPEEWQPVVGWDTLNWHPDVRVPEYRFGLIPASHASTAWVGGVRRSTDSLQQPNPSSSS